MLNRDKIRDFLIENGIIEEYMSSQIIEDEIDFYEEELIEQVERGEITNDELMEIWG